MPSLPIAVIPPPEFAPLPAVRLLVPSGRPRRSRSAFTLLEIMIALAILGMLVTVMISKLGGSFDQAQGQTAKLFVQESMEAPLLAYKIAVGSYPTTEQGLQALVTAPAAVADRWTGPYVKTPGGKLPLDPWKHDYKYRYPGIHNKDGYDLWSMGPDGQDGTEDDIGNW